jgi:hypothetical protein
VRAVVFLGPTLPCRDAEGLIDAEFRPPAGRGDIYRAFRDGFDTIVLIDGEFHARPAVWQREIADVISEGAAVHGAASMGALRAAELHSFGMIGHGRIFAWYRDGVLDADDEVALIYGPAELGYPALSEPLVNIRATLAATVPDILDAAEHDRLIARMRAMPFPERSFDALLAAAPATQGAALAGFLSRHRVDLKRQDAVDALGAVSCRHPAALAREVPSSPSWQWHRLVAEGFADPASALDPIRIAKRAGVSSHEIEGLWLDLSTLFFLGAAAERRGITVDEAATAAAARLFPGADRLPPGRRREALRKRALATAILADAGATPACDSEARRRAVVSEWAVAEGISRPGLAGDTLADWVVAAGPNRFGYASWRFEVELIEALQLAGRFLRRSAA